LLLEASWEDFGMMNTFLRRLAMGLAVLGAVTSGYLTWVKLTNTTALCTGVGECEVVQQSRYADVLGIPVALIGLLCYLAILGCLILQDRRGSFAGAVPYAVFGLSLVGMLYSAYLTYVELFVLYAICPYCVISALLMTALLGLSVYELIDGMKQTEPHLHLK
jgi:uncharacterized membrane protein